MFSLADLDALPVGLIVRHLPAKVQAVPAPNGGGGFRWEYRTAVSAAVDATLLGFAAFEWDGAGWVPRGAAFNAADFAAWYGCPSANLPGGHEFAEPDNFTVGAALADGRTRWVFVAQTASGRRIKGDAIVDLAGELEPRASDLDDPVAQIHGHAERFRALMLRHTGTALAYDQDAIAWLDAYIARNRARFKDVGGLVAAAGCFFGECLRACFDGQWVAYPGGQWGLRVDPVLTVFPLNSLEEHAAEGDDNESLVEAFESIASLKPPRTPRAAAPVPVAPPMARTEAPPPAPAASPEPRPSQPMMQPQAPYAPPKAGWKFWKK